MGGEQLEIDRAAAASLLGWWLESGVDVAVGDEARDWLSAAPPKPVAKEAPLPPETPSDLPAFRQFLATSAGLPLERHGAARVLPSGEAGAPLMLLADLPGPAEAAEGRPLAGDAWLLAEKMLRAIGIAPEAAYVAPLACFHAHGARLTSAELERCAALARDHVRLVAPERLLLFGDSSARALLGQPLARARGKVHRIEGVRAVATFHPRWLLQRPADKALAWKDLQLLIGEEG